MAENNTRPTKGSVTKFIAALPSETRRGDARTLARMLKRVTGESPKIWGPPIIGFGSYHYTCLSGREADMPLAAFSPRKAATVLYVMMGFKGHESLLALLGKHSTGKGCLYIRQLSDVDPGLLETLLAKSVAGMRRKYGVRHRRSDLIFASTWPAARRSSPRNSRYRPRAGRGS